MDVDTAGHIGDALPAMLSVGETWGTDVTALERYWTADDDLGYLASPTVMVSPTPRTMAGRCSARSPCSPSEDASVRL
jgi:hypothetical protein